MMPFLSQLMFCIGVNFWPLISSLEEPNALLSISLTAATLGGTNTSSQFSYSFFITMAVEIVYSATVAYFYLMWAMFKSYNHCSLHWEEPTDNDAASDTSLCAIIHHSPVVQLGQLLRNLHFPPRTPLANWRTSQLGASHWLGALLVCTPRVSVCACEDSPQRRVRTFTSLSLK